MPGGVLPAAGRPEDAVRGSLGDGRGPRGPVAGTDLDDSVDELSGEAGIVVADGIPGTIRRAGSAAPQPPRGISGLGPLDQLAMGSGSPAARWAAPMAAREHDR